MTFDEYMKAVIDYFQIGGVTWEQSYMRVLTQHRPELAEQVVRTGAPAQFDLGYFLYLVFTSWGK